MGEPPFDSEEYGRGYATACDPNNGGCPVGASYWFQSGYGDATDDLWHETFGPVESEPPEPPR